ncbi:MAG TPA: MBL fold metallo-hydrolase [Vicinamibacterales bacterium]|nr:MBL fold metallo-hydrolase [Vicinamibacterales bacterium]
MFDPIPVPAHNPGPMTGDGNNTFLIVSDNGLAALIDAGQGHVAHLAAIDRALSRTDAALSRVLVTHGHPDHASGAPAVAAAYPRAAFYKHPWPGHDERYPVAWGRLDDGDQIDLGDGDHLTVLHTPGHSPDHVAFWHEASRTVFSGDLVIDGGSVMIHASRGGNLAHYLASLERIRSMAPARLLPAHGRPIEHADALLTRYIAHRLAREAQVLEALCAGRHTVQAIAESIYDGLNPALMPAAHETVRAHLEKLRQDGRAVVDADRWSTG